MKKFIIKDTFDVMIKNEDTGAIEFQGSMESKDIEIVRTTAYKYKKGHQHYNDLLSCVGGTLTIEETDDNYSITEGEYDVALLGDVIELTKVTH